MMGVDETLDRAPRAPSATAPQARVMASAAEPLEAYRRCEAITRARAANFYYGIRLLPAPKRRAMCAVYAFARRIDDIGDGGLPPARKLELLGDQARALEALESHSQDPVMLALGDASARFSLPRGALGELIEGVRMDVEGVSYERFEDLLVYCRRVAGAVGRLCLAIFQARPPGSRPSAETQQLADDLGVALQLTNILRDLREDAEGGRVYVPREDLRRFGVLASANDGPEQALGALRDALGRAGGNGAAVAGGEGLAALVRFEAERARQWFDRGIALAALLDRRSAACVLAMAGIYERLLGRIAADPQRAVARRVALPTWEKAWVAAGSMLARDARVRRVPSAPREPIGGRS
jgi:15-cis-phytoene synthase